MNYAGIILAVLKFAGALMAYAQERQLLDAGKEQAIAEVLAEQLSALRRADDVRRRSADELASLPSDKAVPDDGFRRD